MEINFYDNGDTLSVYNYQNDTLNGIFKSYYPNNVLKEIGRYEKGYKKGKIYEYFENGKLKKFSFFKYKTEVPHYSKEFDQEGNLLASGIPVANPNRMLQDTLPANEPFRIGYTLDYSMYERPRLYMIVIDRTNNKNDTLVRMASDTSMVEYDINISKGWNYFTVDLFEYTASSDSIRGFQSQELKYYGE